MARRDRRPATQSRHRVSKRRLLSRRCRVPCCLGTAASAGASAPPVSSVSFTWKNPNGTGKEEARRQENHFCQTSQEDGKRQEAPQVRRHPASEGGDSNVDASGVLTTQESGLRHAETARRDLRFSERRPDARGVLLKCALAAPIIGCIRGEKRSRATDRSWPRPARQRFQLHTS